ncbi:MAG: hypothetical protein KBT11_10695 [Treponema sp.]|nr:hypothetical protein [Candidatus Treponema equifaecale]
MDVMYEEFDGWTEYDRWLTMHYEEFAVVSLDEDGGRIKAGFVDKAEWEKAHR